MLCRFHVLHARTRFRRYRRRRVPFSCFARLNSFSTLPRASGLVFLFCVPVLIFGGTEGLGSRFPVLRPCTSFRRYRGRQVSFSCFALLDTFLAIPRASGPIFMFCAPEIVFGGTEGVASRFHVLRSWTLFRRYQGASGPIFMSCAPGHVFGGDEGVRSRFHVLRSWTYFQRYRGRPVPFSCFKSLDSFPAVSTALSPIFMYCAPELVFGGAEGVRSRFHALRPWTRFRGYQGRRVPFSYFAFPDSFSAVPRVSGPVFMFCAPGLIFGGTECVRSRFHVLSPRSRFRRFRGRRLLFHV
jgi:hypothetical protein